MNSDGSCVRHAVKFSGDLNDCAENLRDRLVDLVEASHVGVLELDLSEVRRIDAAGLQVLLGVSKLLTSRGQALLLSEISPSITRAVYGAGLHHALHRGEITPPSSTVNGRLARVLPMRQQVSTQGWSNADLSSGLEQSGERVNSGHRSIASESSDLFTWSMESTTEDQALSALAQRLRERFPSQPPETIEKVVRDYHRDFDGDPIRDFIPVLVERQAVDRLREVPDQRAASST